MRSRYGRRLGTHNRRGAAGGVRLRKRVSPIDLTEAHELDPYDGLLAAEAKARGGEATHMRLPIPDILRAAVGFPPPTGSSPVDGRESFV
jgi:hypothetical protein